MNRNDNKKCEEFCGNCDYGRYIGKDFNAEDYNKYLQIPDNIQKEIADNLFIQLEIESHKGTTIEILTAGVGPGRIEIPFLNKCLKDGNGISLKLTAVDLDAWMLREFYKNINEVFKTKYTIEEIVPPIETKDSFEGKKGIHYFSLNIKNSSKNNIEIEAFCGNLENLHKKIYYKSEWDLNKMSAKDETGKQKKINKFKTEPKKSKRTVLIVDVNTDTTDTRKVWTIATFNDEGVFVNKELVDDGNKELATELNKKEESDKDRIIKLATSFLGITHKNNDKYNHYDHIFSIFVLHAITNWEEPLYHLLRMLKLGGKIVFAEEIGDINWLDNHFNDIEKHLDICNNNKRPLKGIVKSHRNFWKKYHLARKDILGKEWTKDTKASDLGVIDTCLRKMEDFGLVENCSTYKDIYRWKAEHLFTFKKLLEWIKGEKPLYTPLSYGLGNPGNNSEDAVKELKTEILGNKWEEWQLCDFHEILSRYNDGPSLITVGNISNWDTLLYEIQGDTENLTTKLLASKLKGLEKIKSINVNQLTDEIEEDVVAAFNAIKDNLTFYKDEVASKGIKLSPEVQKELNDLKVILEKSGELKKEESDLSDSQKEDIKWFNIVILKQLFPQIFSKFHKDKGVGDQDVLAIYMEWWLKKNSKVLLDKEIPRIEGHKFHIYTKKFEADKEEIVHKILYGNTVCLHRLKDRIAFETHSIPGHYKGELPPYELTHRLFVLRDMYLRLFPFTHSIYMKWKLDDPIDPSKGHLDKNNMPVLLTFPKLRSQNNGKELLNKIKEYLAKYILYVFLVFDEKTIKDFSFTDFVFRDMPEKFPIIIKREDNIKEIDIKFSQVSSGKVKSFEMCVPEEYIKTFISSLKFTYRCKWGLAMMSAADEPGKQEMINRFKAEPKKNKHTVLIVDVDTDIHKVWTIAREHSLSVVGKIAFFLQIFVKREYIA